MKTDPTLTVAQLIAKLQQFPGDTLVYTEGCDCVGEAVNVDKMGHEEVTSVIITRS